MGNVAVAPAADNRRGMKLLRSVGLWRDWYARIALGLLLLAIVDLFIPDILVHLDVWPKNYSSNPELESFSLMILTRFVLLPIVIAILLLVVAAGRLLLRKKIF